MKPYEFEAMTPQEYVYYAQGFNLRRRIIEAPFRRLFRLIYNINVKESKQLKTEEQLSRHFPLFGQLNTSPAMLTREQMLETFRAQQAASRLYEKQKK